MLSTRVCVFLRVCVCVYVRISGCQLQFCGPEENTAVSLRVLLVPLSYRCATLPLCQFVWVCVCSSPTGNKTHSSGSRVLNKVGYCLEFVRSGSYQILV